MVETGQVSSTDDIVPVAVLPVNVDNGFPQVVYTDFRRRIYRLTYTFLTWDESLVLTIERIEDTKVVWRGRVPEKHRWRVRDPDTGIYILGFYANVVKKTKIEIFVWVNENP